MGTGFFEYLQYEEIRRKIGAGAKVAFNRESNLFDHQAGFEPVIEKNGANDDSSLHLNQDEKQSDFEYGGFKKQTASITRRFFYINKAYSL
jgi:hypothetical protein